MSFTSLYFIVFIIVLCAIYYLVPKRLQWIVLLLANTGFYLCSGIKGFLFLLVTIIITYIITMRLYRNICQEKAYLQENKENLAREEKKQYKSKMQTKRRGLLITGVIFIIGLLAALRYAGFFGLGISFYTFQAVGYIIDVYHKKAVPEKNLIKMSMFLSFFPQVVQGPISRFNDLADTLYKPHGWNTKEVLFGAERVLWGYFKKLVIADRMLVAVSAIVAAPNEYYGAYAFFGMLFYALELYADFTGGIDIAIGVAQMLGIRLTENFDRPYFSKNIAEYWRRWHITLGTWFRDYIFYPLSASLPMLKFSTFARKKCGLTIGKRLPVWISTLAVWTATGIWHGTSWNFVVWGILNGIIILISQEFKPLYAKFHKAFPNAVHTVWYRIFQVVRTVLLLSCLRMLDCYRDLREAFFAFAGMFTFGNLTEVMSGGLLRLGLSVADYIVLAAGVVILAAVSLLQRKESVRERLYRKNIWVQYIVLSLLFFAVVLLGAYGIGYDESQFIYNQF